MKEGSSGIGTILGLIACAAVFFAARAVFPGIGTVLLVIGGILLALIVTLVVLVIVFSKEKKKPGMPPETDAKKLLSRGRAHLMELRRLSAAVRNPRIRELSGDICGSVDQILTALKQQPEDIPNVRQFLNYYLPTLKTILTRYTRLEGSGVPAADMTTSTEACLKDIKTAMQRQYTSLFDNDKLDLTVQMEALTLACKRDGLLTQEDLLRQEQEPPL